MLFILRFHISSSFLCWQLWKIKWLGNWFYMLLFCNILSLNSLVLYKKWFGEKAIEK